MSLRRVLASLLLPAALAAASLPVLSAPASAATCLTTDPGPGHVALSYSSVQADGTHLGPNNAFASQSTAGATVTVHVQVLALPVGSTCIDLSLASYRATSVPMTSGGYQLLYGSDAAAGLEVGDVADLAVLIPMTPGTPGPGCTNPHDLTQNGSGANVPGPYDTTCDGTASGNGGGKGAAGGKPCAGCVGAADNKNPKGQLPGPQDGNAGYECDRNSGIGKGNPAHSGCAAGGFWQIDLITGEPHPYIGTPPGGGPVLSYGSIAGQPDRLLISDVG